MLCFQNIKLNYNPYLKQQTSARFILKLLPILQNRDKRPVVVALTDNFPSPYLKVTNKENAYKFLE